jgi:hypothetical protein
LASPGEIDNQANFVVLVQTNPILQSEERIALTQIEDNDLRRRFFFWKKNSVQRSIYSGMSLSFS